MDAIERNDLPPFRSRFREREYFALSRCLPATSSFTSKLLLPVSLAALDASPERDHYFESTQKYSRPAQAVATDRVRSTDSTAGTLRQAVLRMTVFPSARKGRRGSWRQYSPGKSCTSFGTPFTSICARRPSILGCGAKNHRAANPLQMRNAGSLRPQHRQFLTP